MFVVEKQIAMKVKVERYEELFLKSGKKQMILALSQTSPAAASNSLHFYDRVLRKKKQTTNIFLGNFFCVACLEGLCFNSCAFLS